MRIEWHGPVLLLIGEEAYVAFTNLRHTDVVTEVAKQTATLRRLGLPTEWKVYGHDFPQDLGEQLGKMGYVPDPPETLMVYDLANGIPSMPGDMEGVEIRQIMDRKGLVDAAEVSEKGPGEPEAVQPVRFEHRLNDPTLAYFAAYVGSRPVSVGRLEMPAGRAFASLWGGSTTPAYRHRGIYRALVHIRAKRAHDRGFRYLTVDARETSQPILARLGFAPVTSVRGWLLSPPSPGRQG
ncbi:MAG: GNAT family N-acetyltransferase [Thermoplasmata archaeon]